MRTQMTLTRIVTLAALFLCCAGAANAQAVRLEFHDGRVNLTAQNASLRAILTEWGRLGGTQIVNVEKLGGAPVTLQLTDVPETQALDIILRGSAGYIAGLRAAAAPAGSQSALDRILVVPTAGTAAVVARPAAAVPFVAPQPRPFPQPDPDDDPVSDVPPDDDAPQIRGPRPVQRFNVPQPGGPGPQTPPQPFQSQDDDSPQPPGNAPAPANPFGIQTGSSRPGTISPAPPPQPTTRPPTQRPDPEP